MAEYPPCRTALINSATDVKHPAAAEVHISSDTEQKKVRVSQGYALVIEPFPSMATVLQEIGWKVDAFHPRSLIEANAQQIGSFIRKGKYNFVWIRYPWKRIMPSKRIQRFDQISDAWLQLAGACGIFAVHVKLMGRNRWDPEEPFVKTKYISEHHLCHFGIRLIGNQPSSIVYHILSTKRIDSHKCSHEGEVHANERDLITGKMGAQQEWLRVETELCRKLMKDWCADLFVCLESVDLADSNPTHCDWGSDQHLGLKGSNQARKPDSTPELQKQDTQPTDADVVGSPNNTGANYPTEVRNTGKP